MTDPITFKIDFDARPGAETFEYNILTHALKVNGKAVKTRTLYEGGPIIFGTEGKTVTFDLNGSTATLGVRKAICQINKDAEPIYNWTHQTFKPYVPQV